jgi:hypothetical protein
MNGMNREACRERVIRAVGLIIQIEHGFPGPVSGRIAEEAGEAFREHVEDIFEAACRQFVAVIDATNGQ